MHEFTLLFLAAVAATTSMRFWLATRHMRHVAAHRNAVPSAFAAVIPLAAHQKAADYTAAKLRLSLADALAGAALLLVFTLGGLLQAIHEAWAKAFEAGGYAHGIVFIGTVALVASLVDLPFSVYRTFVVEQRFGFNKMTWRLFVADLVKEGLLAFVIGTPVLFAVLWLMNHMGSLWWFWVWLFWLGFNLLVLLVYPTFIAPLFNKFSPLGDATLKQRIEALLARCGFRSSGLFVMDGSRRSAHGNAYFTGFGAAKRVVFFDTLLERLAPGEIEAVLAHELGHYRHHHVWKRIALLGAGAFAFFALLGWLIGEPWFYHALGARSASTAMALVLFSLVVPVFLFPLAPLTSHVSRSHEFEADAYAARHASGEDLANALVKLYRDNAATLTPDPLYSSFYDSHPPAASRIERLQGA